ncbi:MAG: hypothetical protein ACRCST_11960 [Turicibacter sp.]
MENNANYDELRRLYFSSRTTNKIPSHSKVSNLRAYVNDTLVNTQTTHTSINEEVEQQKNSDDFFEDQDLNEFKKELNQRSSNIINALYDKYGSNTYAKITQMINNEDFSEWNELEKTLIDNKIDSLIPGSTEISDNFLTILSESNLFLDEMASEGNFDDDYAYLDALVQHDYGKLRKYQNEQNNISSLFNEIIENEENSNKNYQDDVFNKNIELIFNENVDLDNSEWDTVIEEYAQDLSQLNLNEAIEQIKENVDPLCDFTEESKNNLRKQTDLNAFYAELEPENIPSTMSDNENLISLEVKKESMFRVILKKLHVIK